MSISTITTNETYLSTPGEILKEEFLDPLGISAYRLSKAAGVSETAISQIIHGQRGISMTMAYRLAFTLGTTPQFWSDLQRDFDMRHIDAEQLRHEVLPLVSVK